MSSITTLKKERPFTFFNYVLLFFLMAFTLFPFLWLLVSSLKPSSELFSGTPTWFSSNFTFDGYHWILRKDGGNLIPYFINSIIASALSMLLTIVFSISGGYALARYKFPGKTAVLILFFLCQMFQGPLIMIPWYRMANAWSIVDTKLCLILIYTTITIPITIFMMSGFFKTIPKELEESAYIDGASKLRTLLQIDIPIVKPGFVAVALLSFILSWNDYQYAFILTNTQKAKTVQIALNEIVTAIGNINWSGLLGGGVLTTIPVILFFAFIQKYLIQGLTAGAVKG